MKYVAALATLFALATVLQAQEIHVLLAGDPDIEGSAVSALSHVCPKNVGFYNTQFSGHIDYTLEWTYTIVAVPHQFVISDGSSGKALHAGQARTFAGAARDICKFLSQPRRLQAQR